MQSTTFQYKKSLQIGYRGCLFHSLIELKYTLREFIKKYVPDFLIRNKADNSAWLIELKPKGFNDAEQVVIRTRVAENYIREKKLDWKFRFVYDDEIKLCTEKHYKFMNLRNNISSFDFKRKMEYIDKKFNNNQRNYFKTIPGQREKNMTPSEYAKLVKYGPLVPNNIVENTRHELLL